MKRRILLSLLLIILFILALSSPRFLFSKTRVLRELNRIVEFDKRLELSSEDIKIVDYRNGRDRMFAKLELAKEKYNRIKEEFFSSASASDLDNNKYFLHIEDWALENEYYSMNLNYYEERFIFLSFYGEFVFPGWTTGEVWYALVKESNDNCCLYVIKR